VTAPDPVEAAYLSGFLDGLVRHPLLIERATEVRTYGIAELAAVYDLGRDAGRAERPGVDEDILDAAQRIYDRLSAESFDSPAVSLPKRPRPRHWPARHLRTAH